MAKRMPKVCTQRQGRSTNAPSMPVPTQEPLRPFPTTIGHVGRSQHPSF
jgi:hypothetical protein